MNKNKTETEKANLRINQILNDNDENNKIEMEPLLNNNNISLVVKNQSDKEEL